MVFCTGENSGFLLGSTGFRGTWVGALSKEVVPGVISYEHPTRDPNEGITHQNS